MKLNAKYFIVGAAALVFLCGFGVRSVQNRPYHNVYEKIITGTTVDEVSKMLGQRVSQEFVDPYVHGKQYYWWVGDNKDTIFIVYATKGVVWFKVYIHKYAFIGSHREQQQIESPDDLEKRLGSVKYDYSQNQD